MDQIETFSIFSATAVNLLFRDIVDLNYPEDRHQVVHNVAYPCVDNGPEGVLLKRAHAAVAVEYAGEGDDDKEEQVDDNPQQTREYHDGVLPS